MTDTTEETAPEEPVETEKTAEQIAAEQAEAGRVVEVETRASRMGWTPKDKFRGDPEKWVDAETFIHRGETMVPIMRERTRAMEDRLQRQEQAFTKQSADLDEFKQRLTEVTTAFSEYRTFAQKSEERSYRRAKAELEAKMAQAVSTGDTVNYHAAKAELDTLDRDRPPPAAEPAPREPAREPPKTPVAPPAPDPEILAWVADNPWFEREPTMKAYAMALNAKLIQEKPGLSTRDNLAEVKRSVKERFPEQFSNVNREAPPSVSTPTAPAAVSRKKGKGFDDIPAADRRPYEEFKRWMPDYTKEEFAKQYFAGDE